MGKLYWIKYAGLWQPGEPYNAGTFLVIGLEWEVTPEEVGAEIIYPKEYDNGPSF